MNSVHAVFEFGTEKTDDINYTNNSSSFEVCGAVYLIDYLMNLSFLIITIRAKLR